MFIFFSTCLCARHQEKQLCLCNTWYLLFCVDDCLVCRSICSYIPDSHPYRINKYQVSHKYSCFSWWWAHSRPKHVQKRNKHTKKNCAPVRLYLQVYTEVIRTINFIVYISVHWYWMNTNHCNHILVNHHFINTSCNSNMFQHLEGHLQGV
jgi:hypothetical protein